MRHVKHLVTFELLNPTVRFENYFILFLHLVLLFLCAKKKTFSNFALKFQTQTSLQFFFSISLSLFHFITAIAINIIIDTTKNIELHSSELLNEEMQRYHDQINSRNAGGNDSLWATLKRPEIYKPLGIINAFFAFQQFSGTFVIVVYAAQFATEAGAGIDKFLCTVLIGVARVIATIILAYFILDRYGRKPPTIFSGIGKLKMKIFLSFLSFLRFLFIFASYTSRCVKIIFKLFSTVKSFNYLYRTSLKLKLN